MEATHTLAAGAGRRGAAPCRDHHVRLPTGLRLHFLDYGGDGDIVVALPGYVQNARAFGGAATALAPRVRFLAVDLRGRGGSDWGPPDQYLVSQYVQDVRLFVETLGLRRFALLGTSLGAIVAFLYAIFHPSGLTRLVLNDFTMDADLDEAVALVQRYSGAPARFASIADAVAWFAAERDLDALDDDVRREWIGHYLCPAEDGGFRFNCDPVLLRHAAQRPAPRPIVQRIIMHRARQLALPVLLLRGANSSVTSHENARGLVETLPAARSVEVPGVGHSPTLYEPVAQQALRDFFGIGGSAEGGAGEARRLGRRPPSPRL